MKRLFLIPLLTLLVCGLIFNGCAAPSPTPAPPPGPLPTPVPVEPIKLRLAHAAPPMSVFHWAIYEPWVEKIEARTADIGKPVEITIFHSQSIAKEIDAYDTVTTGVIDIISWQPNLTAGRFPLNTGTELPFLFPSARACAMTAHELWETWPEFREETAGVKVLFFHSTGAAAIHARTKHIKTLEDIKGLKVPVSGAVETGLIKALGATPVAIHMPEVYTSLERGLLDLVFISWEGSMVFKFGEVAKYRTYITGGHHLNHKILAMNWDTWNGLPQEVQKIFEEEFSLQMAELAGEAYDKQGIVCLEKLKKDTKEVGDPEIYNMPEDECQRWVAAVTPLYEKWIADMEAKGLPGRAIFEDIRLIAEKYSK